MTNIIEENHFAFCRYLGSLNSSFKKSVSIGAMSTGVPISDINWVFNDRPLNHDSADRIAEIKKYYEKLNLRFWWWVYPCGQSIETDEMLQNAGLRLYAKVPCMSADLNNLELDYNMASNIKIFSVNSKTDLLLWKDVSFDGFEMSARAKEQYGNFVLSFNINSSSLQKLFIAYLDEKPVATSMLFMHKKTAGIYYVSTLPDYRNKGCGLKITQAAMKVAKDSGFKDVILQATPLGAKVYKRTGFKECCHADIYKLRD